MMYTLSFKYHIQGIIVVLWNFSHIFQISKSPSTLYAVLLYTGISVFHLIFHGISCSSHLILCSHCNVCVSSILSMIMTQ